MTLKNRLVQLEKQTSQGGRVVVVYEDETPADKLAVLQNDPSIETLVIVQYVDQVQNDNATQSN